jgi:tetratricopeptide (TPR) repeat protein
MPRTTATASGLGYGTGSGTTTVNSPSSTIYANPIPDNLTDAQIEKMTYSEKESGAKQLLERASYFADKDANYKKAEQTLLLALKLSANDVKILNKLGDVLYQQKKYKDSLVYLNRSLLLDSTNADTKFAIGADYLKMSYYEDARRIFADLVARDPKSFETQFNLGQAYKGLGQYYSAVATFRTATEIKPTDADAHYEYAVSLNKIGTQEDVLEEYQKLLDISPKTAEKLRKDLGLKNVPTSSRSSNGQGSGDVDGYRIASGAGGGGSSNP